MVNLLSIVKMKRTHLLSLSILLAILSGCGSPLTKPDAEEVLPAQKLSLFYQPFEVKSTEENTDILAQSIQDARNHQSLTPPLTAVNNTNKGDIWCRIRDGYRLQVRENSYIRRSIERYVRSPRYFKAFSAQASPYLYHIVEEVQLRGMPLEIALLPAIESAYRPNAVSPMRAVGFWQFTADTAKTFKLPNNAWYDGRRDLVASTEAALDYLQKLHDDFNGDWLHAIAAYNYGPMNIRRAIDKNLALGKPTDFWSLDLPAETRQFVPNLLAVAKIVANPQEYGIKLQPIEDSPYLEPVEVGNQVDLTVAAQLAGLSTIDLKRFNPGYRRLATAPQGPHCIMLPVDKAEKFKQRIAEISPQALMPNKAQAFAEVALEEKAEQEQLAQESAAKEENTQVAVTSIQKHRVSRGETLRQIAERYNTTVSELVRLNRTLSGLVIGKSILVPVTLASSKKTAAVSNRKRVIHTVQIGDSLRIIAQVYQVSVDELSEWNRLPRHFQLRSGQKLTIWLNG